MKRTTGLVLAVTAALCAGSSVRAAEPSLYERLGGMPAIRAVVDGLLDRIQKDDRVNGWFGWAAQPQAAASYKASLADFVCQASGGPCKYRGPDLKSVHTGMAITQEAFHSVVEDLTAVLDQLKVPAAEKNELLGLLAPLQGQIVGQ
ncbi:MAG TPA: group 1 truncated hemoglobin [Bryobacteraceae bacterium]|nr:group 1 truncated hemoglobin [Bryobacteraceae bacterium]